MSRKVFTTVLAVAMALSVASAASAIELNIAGASAQFKFWKNAADDFLLSKQCTITVNETNDKGFADCGVIVGTDCDSYTGSPTIIIRYSSVNSSYGIGTACRIAAYSSGGGTAPDLQLTCPTGQIEQCNETLGPNQKCRPENRVCKEVHVGASDVEVSSMTQQTTYGYSWDGTAPSCPDGSGPHATEFAACLGTAADKLNITDRVTIVPFGFVANNRIKKYRCDKPNYDVVFDEGIGIGKVIDKAYPAFQWECDPDKSIIAEGENRNEDCVGYYKCIDVSGTFRCGGVDQAEAVAGLSDVADVSELAAKYGKLGQTCSSKKPSACPDVDTVTLTGTDCRRRPIDNLSRVMAVTIFSVENFSKLQTWNQFGPYYEVDRSGGAGDNDQAIIRCMRCAGSGTHATMDLMVMRGDKQLIAESDEGTAFMHTSSSDLQNCVGFFDGGIGYQDVDKTIDDDVPTVHILKYQGVEPKRWKIENCEYPFWAKQVFYANTAELTTEGNLTVYQDLRNFALNNIDAVGFPSNEFWTAPANLACEKKFKATGVESERGYFDFK